jgi:hypothetical protein
MTRKSSFKKSADALNITGGTRGTPDTKDQERE